MIPTTTKIRANKIEGNKSLLSQNKEIASGISDKKDIVSITPLANKKEQGNIFSSENFFK